ncbi:MAG TPA: hypothetical protein PKB02_07850 [Anaerohalosphaeraceae bacterium]|nr:hypothetical protein [Anaerohalosphaeraceae bacterium]
MIYRPSSPKTPVILMVVGISLIFLSILIDPGILLSLFSYRAFIPHAITITASLIAAQVLRHFAEVLLRPGIYPWYLRRGALGFFIGISFMTLPLYIIALKSGMHLLNAAGAIHLGRLLEFAGMELFWIVYLDWPVMGNHTSETPDEESPNDNHSSRARFRPFKPFK